MTPADTVRAAGTVVHDLAGRVAVIHRPRYDDWSLPKGKLEPGETYAVAAVRECREETGLRVRLEAALPEVTYAVAGGSKLVRYWRASIVTDEGFVPGAEVDRLRWLLPAAAVSTLTHPVDRTTVSRSVAVGPTRALVVLRHAEAMARSDWAAAHAGAVHAGAPDSGSGDSSSVDDEDRPLTDHGVHQAAALAGLLGCYGVERIVSSPSLRCRQSVAPLAAALATPVELDDRYSEQGAAADPDATRAAYQRLVEDGGRTVLCTHRPVLPLVLATLVADQDPLEPGACVVLHRGPDGTVAARERHPSPASPDVRKRWGSRRPC